MLTKRGGAMKKLLSGASASLVGALLLVPSWNPAGAAPLAVDGEIRCTITNAALTFTPPLVDVPARHAKRSFVSNPGHWVLSECEGSGGAPAPGGIDHGWLRGGPGAANSLKGRVKAGACGALSEMRLRVTIDWFDAGHQRLLGFTRVGKLATTIQVAADTDPETFVIAGAVPAPQQRFGFGGKPVAFTFQTSASHGAVRSLCSGSSLPGLAFQDGGVLTIGQP